MKIYITHCSDKKDDSLKNTGIKVTPDRLYKGKRVQAFMRRCMELGKDWAIFSDQYGIWFPHEQHEWYEKSPNDVSENEYELLLRNFDDRLLPYENIYFYRHPARFHKLYKKITSESNLKDRIKFISRISEIV